MVARGLLFLLLFFCSTSLLAGSLGYYQSPTLHEDTVVFAAEGDLWAVSVEGGTARRLTSHATEASDPYFSPDGEWIAFTGRYEGAAEVYVMPASGGEPQRLTWKGGHVQVQGWTPAGEVLFASNNRVGPSWYWLLKRVNPESRVVSDLPLADAREGAFLDESRLVFTRFGLGVTMDNARAYRGGAMAQLWQFDLDGDNEARRVAANHGANLTHPMSHEGGLYVRSDESGLFNLGRLDPDSGEFSALTAHEDFEVRRPAMGDQGRIVYQHGADIRLLDVSSGEDRQIDIVLSSDRAHARERWLDSPMDYLDSVNVAPEGDRVALTARGRLAIVGTGELRRIEIELPEASRARQAVIDPDGEWVYAFVDASDEVELWRFPANGRGEGEQLTDDASTQRMGLSISPDGRYVAHHDMDGRLFLFDTRRGRNRQIDDSDGVGYRQVVWSPDGQALAVVRPDSAQQRVQVLLYDVRRGDMHTLSSDRYESHSPVFSPDGRWLYFLSNRHFQATPGSPWGDRNMGPMFDRRTQIFALALQPGNVFPLQPRHELIDERPDHGKTDDIAGIQWDGLADRLHEVPVDPGNYDSLVVGKDRLFLIDRPTGGSPRVQTLDFGKDRPRLETFGEGLDLLQASAERDRLLLRRNGELFIVQAGGQMRGDLEEARVRIGNWRLPIRPAVEWQQMFADAWRMQRDFLFDPAMRGVDWEGVREKYAPFVERIADRRELDDLLSQMVAELGVLHSQVRGGEYRDDPETARPAFLGADFEPVDAGARVTRIYRSDPELPSQRSPLARPGVDLSEGDVITHVNGRAVNEVNHIHQLLAWQAGEQTRLDYRRGRDSGAVIVHPINGWENDALRYRDWVSGRREVVERASDGRIGYLHLRAMGPNDIADFAREFYANVDREGLIIDVRRNRGGNIDSWIIEKLLRRAWSFWQPPGQPEFWNMQNTFRGHLAVLIDPLTYSDGETFSAGVKSLGLGPLIGQQTAGAGVWLSDQNRLVDRGLMRAASLPVFDAEGNWIVEGRGVAPDIHVENLPHATFRGEDAQLQRAVRELLDTLEEQPITRPEAQPIPPLGTPGRDVSPLD
ncbi:S41 family peptidase [Natronospira bacteriovora]|uniref:Tricorn protease homolog n=1 Tax=Natronospira bacteriovora TaxID=3069753 RepID=A0ABU0W8H8_9GAMM|nr:S41 family peptidase [Natronospira sp. AB-CW4]MDQ2070324.1 S41 family peptidase [Natronospira sp. AB-CW4]